MSPGVFYFIHYHTEFHGSRIIEFANYHLSHGISRNVTDVLLYHELSNYRIHDKIYKSEILCGTPCEEKFDNSIIRDP